MQSFNRFFFFSGGVDEIFICTEKGEVRILSNKGKTFSSNCILISKGICSLSNSDHKFWRKNDCITSAWRYEETCKGPYIYYHLAILLLGAKKVMNKLT